MNLYHSQINLTLHDALNTISYSVSQNSRASSKEIDPDYIMIAEMIFVLVNIFKRPKRVVGNLLFFSLSSVKLAVNSISDPDL